MVDQKPFDGRSSTDKDLIVEVLRLGLLKYMEVLKLLFLPKRDELAQQSAYFSPGVNGKVGGRKGSLEQSIVCHNFLKNL